MLIRRNRYGKWENKLSDGKIYWWNNTGLDESMWLRLEELSDLYLNTMQNNFGIQSRGKL